MAVPSQIYKLVYEPSSGRAAAYLESSQPGEIYSVIDLNELQHITSFNFLPKTKVTGVIDLPAAHVGKSSLSIRNGMKNDHHPVKCDFQAVKHFLKVVRSKINY